jgi:hypothetical protein
MFGIDDAAAATIGSAALGFLSGQLTNDRSADQAAANNAWSAQQYATRYQTMTEDLKAAGLNPMLAYSQSPGTAPTAQAVQFQNPMSSAADAMRSASGSVQSIASAKQADSQSKLIDETVEKVKKETRNLDDEQTRLRAAYINLAESSALMAQQGQSEVVKRQVLDATARKMVTENLLSRAEYDAMVKTGFIGVTAREVKVLSDVSSEWVDKFLPWKQGKSVSEEHTDIVRDRKGREVGRSTYRSRK